MTVHHLHPLKPSFPPEPHTSRQWIIDRDPGDEDDARRKQAEAQSDQDPFWKIAQETGLTD